MGHHYRPRHRPHSYVDDIVDNVARNLAARASSAYTHVWALLASAASAIATSSRYYSPASIYARLVVASSVALAATLDQLERTVCCEPADEMLSRIVSWLVLKPARIAYFLTSPTVRPLRRAAPYELYFQGPSEESHAVTTVCRLREDAAETLIQILKIFLFVRCVAPIVHTSALILLRL